MTTRDPQSDPSAVVIERLLRVIADDVVPLTQEGTARGNKVFGAAILDRESLDVVVAATNAETQNPLFHGEVAALNEFWSIDAAERPDPKDCLFVATHEPCSLCLSAITWSGFDNFFYLFTYQDSRDAFAIPHDLRIMDEVFGLESGEYNRANAFWTAYSIGVLIDEVADDDTATRLRSIADAIRTTYAEISGTYQSTKDATSIPLS